jgi:hypothetical protein
MVAAIILAQPVRQAQRDTRIIREAEINLPLCLIEQSAMMTYGRGEDVEGTGSGVIFLDMSVKCYQTTRRHLNLL